MGYSLKEIKGKNRSIFVEPADKASAEYRQFLADLDHGKFNAGEFKRLGKGGKGGKEVWIQASYNPILDPDGNPFKVVRFATDITQALEIEKRKKEMSESLKQTTMNIVNQNAQALSAASAELAKLAAELKQVVDNVKL